ncbi:hypothetical protein, partial [Megasphaera elsdenii]
IYTTSSKLLYHNFFAKSLLFIIERRGGAAPLMTKVTSLRRTIVMKSIRKDAKLFSLRKRTCVSAAVPILKRDET